MRRGWQGAQHAHNQPTHSDRTRRLAPAGGSGRRSCLVRAPQFRSLPAIARRRPAASTTRNCASSRSASATRASWRIGAPPFSLLDYRRAGQSLRPSSPAPSTVPRPRSSWKHSMLQTSPSGARKAQIAREAGLEPLADALLSTRQLHPGTTEVGKFVDAEPGVADTLRRRWRVRAILSSSALLKRPRSWAICANGCGRGGALKSSWCARARMTKAPSSPTTSSSASASGSDPIALGPSPCCAAQMRVSSTSISMSRAKTAGRIRPKAA